MACHSSAVNESKTERRVCIHPVESKEATPAARPGSSSNTQPTAPFTFGSTQTQTQTQTQGKGAGNASTGASLHTHCALTTHQNLLTALSLFVRVACAPSHALSHTHMLYHVLYHIHTCCIACSITYTHALLRALSHTHMLYHVPYHMAPHHLSHALSHTHMLYHMLYHMALHYLSIFQYLGHEHVSDHLLRSAGCCRGPGQGGG